MDMDMEMLDPEAVHAAAKVLGLGERETIEDIKKTYRELVKRWHPDNCNDDPETCRKKTEEIVNAYEVVMAYCTHYRFSFKKDDIIRNLPVAVRMNEQWKKQFMDDPLWK
jgi:hypothetical protein